MSIFGCILKVLFWQNVLKTCNCRQNLLFRSRNDPKTWSIRQILRSRQRGAEQHGEAGEPDLTNVCRNRGRRVRGQRGKKRLKPDSSAELHRVTEIDPADFETILGPRWDDFG